MSDLRIFGILEGEKVMYVEYLVNYWFMVWMKCEGLDVEQLVWCLVLLSMMSLFGLVWHLV